MTVTVITKTQHLSDLCTRLSQSPYVTVDTEFLREKTYYSKLCLIQIANNHESAIIDPLSPELNLSPLWDLMKNDTVTKVFHAGRQDLEIFYHMMGQLPQNLFDTQIAAMVCGFGEQVGYETLVQNIVKESLDKSSRFTDWSHRPLTDKQLNYAIGDVTHLRTIYDHLYKILSDNNRLHWLEEEFAALTSPATYVIESENIWQRLRTRGGKPEFLVILKYIAWWREDFAKRKNLPRQRILRDDTLLDIAANAPQTINELQRIRGMPKGIATGHQGKQIIKTIAQALASNKDSWPVVKKTKAPPQWVAPMADMLKVLLKYYATQENVASRVIASNADIEAIAQYDKPNVPAMKGWRYDIFGQYAQQLKQGNIAITADKSGIKIIPL